jgi:hypothetical protein
MKIKETCKRCDKAGHNTKVKISVTINPADRDTYFKFSSQYKLDLISKRDDRASQLFMPPSKYPKSAQAPLVIPNSYESPCAHCKYGEETVGPRGCGRGDNCLALACHNFLTSGNIKNNSVVTSFLKGTPNWDLPTKKYTKKAIGTPTTVAEFENAKIKKK